MSLAFSREKRTLLGLLALAAPLPLPFNEVVGWPSVGAFVAGAAWFVWNARRDREVWLAPWMMNLLGLAYLPLFWIDLRVLSGGRMVAPVIHLALFAILIKLFAVRRERDKWQALIGVFFLFLASMATSVHPSVVVYLAVFLAGALLLLARFAFLHLVAGFGHRDPGLARLPLGGFVTGATLTTLALAVPLFALLPRVTSPYIVGRGGGAAGSLIQTTGFSDEVTLDSIGRIRGNRDVAMRVEWDGVPREEEMRFKAATFDRYDGRAWRRSPRARVVQKPATETFIVQPGPVRIWAEVWLQPVTGAAVPLPMGTRQLKIARRGLAVGRGGAVELHFPATDVTAYSIGVGEPDGQGAPPPDGGPDDPALDLAGVSPQMAGLAARVMGEGDAELRARRLERYLSGPDFTYTLDFVGRRDADPLDDFLFRRKSGHCEYFASAMVLLLRSQGMPARLAAGFLGGELNPLTGYYVVRQSNAHAWVEAWMPGAGWRVFDPTPVSGRPTAEPQSWLGVVGQTWDYVVFRWDRYVLTYGFNDQVALFGTLRLMWSRLVGLVPVGGGESGDEAAPAPPIAGVAEPAAEPPAAISTERAVVMALLALSLLAAAVALVLRYRPPLTATRAYRRLRRTLEGAGLAAGPATAPLALGRRAAERYPAAAEPTARVVAFYLRESFGGQDLDDTDREELRDALGRAAKALRRAG
jgi:transglutaminase-like putative cysteine protease